MNQYRTETDFLGIKKIPHDCYFGVQTQRAVENFSISGIPISQYPQLLIAFGYVKKASAMANNELGRLPTDIAKAIKGACDDIIEGKLHNHFVVDVLQGGAGTSTNMNVNEVIANRALELMGRKKGEYKYCHPNNHVNCSQSTNDVYPTALRIALYLLIEKLIDAIEDLQTVVAGKADEFSDILKIGRTQLQDAVPMTLGQEFSAYATTIGEDILRIKESLNLIREINLGATAIGTGINAPPNYASIVTKHLRVLTGLDLVTSPNLVEATWDTGVYVQISGVLKRFALKLSKICNDLRLLSSGPRAGFNEINLPRVQPGSSIMPGKVNPVIPEVVNQVAFQVVGADLAISMASEAGQLELNAMEPVIAYNLFFSIHILKNGCITLADKCIVGITANRDRCRELLENSTGIITTLVPLLGYETCSKLASEALAKNLSIYQLLLDREYFTEHQLSDILSTEKMVGR